MTLSEQQKGILGILSSAVFFSCMSCCVRLSGDLPVYEKALFRNLIAAFVATTVFIKEKPVLEVDSTGKFYLIVRAIVGTLGMLCNFYAIDRINLSDANMLNKMSPFFSLLFSWLFLKETLKPIQIGIVVVSFLGSLLILKPSTTFLFQAPSYIALSGGCMAGMAFVGVRGATQHGAPKSLVVLVFSVFSCLFFLPLTIANYVPLSLFQILCLLCCGLFGAAGQFSVTYAYSHAPAKDISVYEYAQVIFAAILGFIFFDQLSDVYSFLGYVIIIGMGVLNTRISKK